EVNIKEFLDEVVLLFQGMAREKEVTICKVEMQEKIISLDYRRMNQVFINLFLNAVKFSPVGGIVTLEMKVGADEVSISVLNQGEQIPVHELKSIFFRYETRQETGMRGAGLGLAIARGLVQAHGGRLEVSSVAGEIRFTVILPLGKSDPEDEETMQG
ncbi:MAG: HAMP domain-containing histidine kinase, partial [Deltaproteobacteria bacterium]|nr:HAMP domain-containing histidine kinase [Deltaproteobacteria bacterium]